jgi:hypothetical protein
MTDDEKKDVKFVVDGPLDGDADTPAIGSILPLDGIADRDGNDEGVAVGSIDGDAEGE